MRAKAGKVFSHCCGIPLSSPALLPTPLNRSFTLIMYTFIKIIHMSFAMISVLGFLARGILKINESPLVDKKLVRVLPHVIDTVLLASAITLVIMSGQYPWVAPWVSAKILGLVVYIGLGVVVMRTAKTRQARIAAFALALITVGYVFMVASTKTIF